MSIMTIGQVKTEIRATMANRTDLNARLDGVINLSQMRLARLHDFDELRAIATINTAVTASAAADKIISLSTLGRFRKIYSIRLYADNQLSRKLEWVLPKLWDKRIPEPEYYARGTPTSYTLWGKDQMELWKVPDIVYPMHFRYSRWPTVVNNTDADELDLENMEDLVIHLSASYLHMSLGSTDKAMEYFKIYSALAKDALDEDEQNFDRDMMSRDSQMLNRTNGRGFDDPFVRSVEVDQS